jgi:hypothetical protein
MVPESFVRHYEDAARIIGLKESLPPLDVGLASLADEMVAEKQIARRPSADDRAFTLADEDARRALVEARQAIAPMFWGARRTLEEACEVIHAWVWAPFG